MAQSATKTPSFNCGIDKGLSQKSHKLLCVGSNPTPAILSVITSMELKNYFNINRYHIPYLINNNNYQNYVEIGIQSGVFTEYVLKNTNIPVYGVDPFQPCNGNECGWDKHHDIVIATQEMQDETKNICIEKLSKFNNFNYINMSSIEYGLSIPDNSLDIVFIDGDHSTKGVTKDLEIFYKKIRKGGFLVGHDYGGNFGIFEPVVQVQPAVDNFCLKNNLKYVVSSPDLCFEECLQSYFIYKK